jgi:hypothetical protein
VKRLLFIPALLALLAAAPRGAAQEAQESPAPGLEIRSTPEEAAVYLGHRLMGSTPLVIRNLEPGRYRLALELDGYYRHTAWIDYRGGYQVYETTLVPITGFLLLRVRPADARVTIGAREVSGGTTVELPVGSYPVEVRRFGYEPFTGRVEIDERSLSTLEVNLPPAEFRLSPLELSRRTFNPRNAAALGRVTVSFEVTGPGGGRAWIVNERSQEVYRTALPDFRTWEQSFIWPGTDARGDPLPDGEYRIAVEARGRGGAEILSREATVYLDSSLVIRFRGLWNGASGLLFSPSPEVLPPGAVQLSSLLLVRGRREAEQTAYRIPWGLGLRWGFAGGWELDAQAGITAESAEEDDDDFPPLFAGAAVKAPLFELGSGPAGPGLAAALLLKAAYQNAHSDLLTSFSGLSAALPLQAVLGRLSLLLAPEIIVSAWRVDEPGGDGVLGVWLYGRAGLILDLGPLGIGLSIALRSTPLDRGLALDPPLPVGLEAHWMIPDTQLVLSLAAAGELDSAGSYSLMAGGGLGLLF